MSQTLWMKLKGDINSRATPRLHRRLDTVVRLDQTVDQGTTATAAATGAAGFTHLVPATRTIGDASSNRGVVHGMAVTDQHAFFIAPRS